MATYARFLHNGQVQTVALCEGLQTDELVTLLKTIFGVSNEIVGILAEKGLVIPISLVAKNPQVVPNSVCKLLVAGAKPVSAVVEAPVLNSATLNKVDASSTRANVSESSAPSSERGDPDHDQVTEEESIEYVTNEIRNFVEGLRAQNFITANQLKLLLQLLKQNATLLFAAYSVAISANDSEYFAEICKDLGNSLLSPQGRVACEAQDEVLQVCDQLYINGSITENQLLYLRHLVLIRDEAVASVYDDFQEHSSVSLLASALHHLANTHPFQSRDREEDEQEDDDEQDDVEEGEQSFSAHTLLSGLSGVLALMLRARNLTTMESTVLLDMINQENEFVVAAYDLYKRDQNLEDLQDTLLRCVKLEMRKRVADAQEAELRQEEENEGGEEDQDSEEEEDDDQDDEEEDDEEEEDEEEDEAQQKPASFSIETISLDSILRYFQVDNTWDKIVPEPFMRAVFVAAVNKDLTVDQAKALCDLFHAKYDVVHAAWEVYQVQNDVTDFIDTVRRVVRDLDFEELKKELAPKPVSKPTPAAKPAGSPPKTAPSSATGVAAPTTSATAQAQEMLDARRQDALQAVQVAKFQLLRHSLEMLATKGLTTVDKANALLQRYQEGDVMVDAAIETYAGDRDVVEFLDTLQILANNSKEDLEDLMRAAEADEQERPAKQPQAKPQAQPQPQTKPHSKSQAEPQAPEGSMSIADIAFLQIEDIVREMRKNDMIGPNIAQAFQVLIGNRDARLVVAYQAYLETKNGADLVDTLLRIVIASVEGTDGSTAKVAPSPRAAAARAGGKTTSVTAADQKSVINILLRAKAISAEQAAALSDMADSGDTSIQTVFLAYEEHKDIYKLMDELKDLGGPRKPTPKSSPVGKQSQTAPDDEEDDDEEESEADEDEEDDDEEEEEEADLDDDDRETVDNKFISVVQSMDLSDIETAALRLAIAKDDPAVRRAIDVYRSTNSEAALKQALVQVARDTIRATLEADDDDEEEEEDDDQEDDDQEDDDQEDDDQEDDDQDEDEEPDRDSKPYGSPLKGSLYTPSPVKNSPYKASPASAAAAAAARGSPLKSSPQALQHSPIHSSPVPKTSPLYKDFDYDQAEDASESENSDEDGDDEGDEGDEEEEEDSDANKGLTSRAARDHVFPILVNELVKESIVSSRSGNLILKLFAQGNAEIDAALDVYDRNSNMGELVEALQLIVENNK